MKVLKFLFSVTIGLVYGLLFAQKSGKKFRQDLRTSKNPTMTFLKELWDVDKGAVSDVAGWAKDSEMLQEVMGKGSKQFDAFVNQAKALGEGAVTKAHDELETLANNAQAAARDLEQKAQSVKKAATKKVETAKKAVTKKTAAAKKAVTKKTTAVKKAATKKVAAVKKSIPKKK